MIFMHIKRVNLIQLETLVRFPIQYFNIITCNFSAKLLKIFEKIEFDPFSMQITPIKDQYLPPYRDSKWNFKRSILAWLGRINSRKIKRPRVNPFTWVTHARGGHRLIRFERSADQSRGALLTGLILPRDAT